MNNSRIDLKKNLYSKSSYNKIINSNFKNLGIKTYEEEIKKYLSLEELFENYELLFFEIPQFGETNSHEYLVKKSSEYINFNENSDIINALQDEIAKLREENLQKDLQILKLETGDKSITQDIISSLNNG